MNALKRPLRWLRNYIAPPLRRVGLRRSARPRKVEIGGGMYPTPGYIHVDQDRRSLHLEYIAPAWKLPFPDSSVDELLAVHVLEHVHPTRLNDTLREWRRVLAPSGVAQIHIPDGAALARAYLDAPLEARWAIGAALLGMDTGPEVRAPTDFHSHANLPDHKMVLDRDLLRHALIEAGFSVIEDASDSMTDRHTEAWEPVVPRISAIFRAVR